MHQWFIYSDSDLAAKAAADFIAEKITVAIYRNGICHVVLPGGNTPASCLGYLAAKELLWDKVHWYPGDERCLPAGDAGRNDVMLEKQFWSRLPQAHVHPIPAELGAEKAAEIYREMISAIDCFDVAFLGMGEDGHTASLFPDNQALQDTRSVVPVYDSPKAPDERVSLSLGTLSQAQCRLVLTAGAEKSAVIARVKNNEALPINRLGDINWFVDALAASARHD